MSTLASSANMVARVTVQSTGASYHIELTDPPKHGECWIIGSAPTADIDLGHKTPDISGKHRGLDFDQDGDGMVIVKIFSSRGISLAYESETVEGTKFHDGIGENSRSIVTFFLLIA